MLRLVCLLLLVPLPLLAQEEVPTDAYAVVGSSVITKQRVKAEAGQGLPEAAALQRVVQLEILRHNLVQKGHDPAKLSDEELKAGVEDAARELGARGLSLDDAIARSGRTREQFVNAMRVSVTFSNYVASLISDEEVGKGFEDKALRIAGRIRASHVFVKVDEKQNAEAARAKASKIIEDLQAAKDLPTAVAEAARTRSDDPVGALTDGDLDWFDARGRGLNPLPRSVIQACFQQGKVGLLAEPIQSPAGMHVLYVSAVQLPQDATLEKLLPKLRAEAEGRKAAEIMGGWLRSTPVRYAKDAPKPPKRPR